MSKENPTNESQSLADAEALLAATAKTYNETGETQFESLVLICDQISALKEIFKKTPKALRPEPTWDEYAEAAAKRCHLRFKSARMADLYIALHKDIKKVGAEAIKQKVTDGSYREARSVANELSEKTESNPPVNPAIAHLHRSLKGLQNAEASLTEELLLETGPIKASIQSILDRVKAQGKPAPQGKPVVDAVPVAPPQLPPEWQEKLAQANAATDQVSINEVVDTLWTILSQGGVAGFPAEVTFSDKPNDLGEQFRRHLLIKQYMARVKKSLGLNFAMPQLPATPAAPTTDAHKANPTINATAPFEPKNVREIANALGGQTALGKAAGKQNAHASYWIRQNKLPGVHFAAVIAALKKKGCEPDLSSIAKIAEKHAA